MKKTYKTYETPLRDQIFIFWKFQKVKKIEKKLKTFIK